MKRRFFTLSRFSFLLPLAALAMVAGPEASARSRTRIYDPLMDEVLTEEAEASPSWQSLISNPLGLFDFRLPSSVEEKYFAQKLNPADPNDARTYPQRYYVYSGYASGAEAPVVLYIGGEAELTPRSFMGRFAETVAQALHAHLIGVEHRYYGKSQPFELLTPENLQYLSTDNAIEDLARFQRFAMSELGFKGKWLAIGGSYPGSLSAYYRLKHPELVVGALASSAPVEARNAFVEYDSHVADVLPRDCAEALRKVVAAAEASLTTRESARAFKARFNAADVQNDVDFLYVLADVTADAVQYGYPERLCGKMAGAADPVAAYAEYVRDFLDGRDTTASDFSPAVALKLGAQESEGMRQWLYQSCREYGYWQDAHPDRSRSVRSSLINSSYDRESCRRFYGLSDFADEAAMNARYYQPLLDPAAASRILFTNGSDDPWSELSITRLRGNDTNPNTVAYLIQGKAHCSDLRALSESDPASLKEARSLFLGLAADWLK